MMKQPRRLCAVLAAVLAFGVLALPAYAQAPVIAAVVDRDQVTTDDQVTLSVAVDAAAGEPGQPVLPALLDDFQLVDAANSTQISTVNGATSVQVLHQYVLRPLRAGQLVIQPVTVDIGGQTYQTKPIPVTVTAGSGQPGSGTAGGGSAAGGSGAGGGAGGASGAGRGSGTGSSGGLGGLPSLLGSGIDPLALLDQLGNLAGEMPVAADGALSAVEAPKALRGQDYLVEASVDNANPYQGEQVVYTVRFYQAVNPLGQIDYRQPAFTGFWSKQEPDQKQYRTQAAGRDYRVAELRTVLFPTMAGQTRIDPARLTVPGGFSRPGAELASQAVTLQVKQLPGGAPASFRGAVGQYQIEANVDNNSVKVGDTVTQQVRISGLGNLETLADPQWPESPAWRAFDSKAQTTTTSQGGKLGGTRTYSRTLMPTAPGSAVVPAIEFAYFDPTTGGYHTVATDAVAVTVAADAAAAQADQAPSDAASSATGAAASAGANAGANTKVVLAHPAVRPIHATTASWQAGAVPLPQQPWYVLLWALPLLLLAGQYVIQRRQAALQANPALVRSRTARRQAQQELAIATRHPERAGRSTEDVLTGYLAAKLNRPVAGLTQQQLAELLLAHGIDSELAARTQGCLLASQSARYAPGAASEPKGALLAETAAIVEDLEQQWNGGKS